MATIYSSDLKLSIMATGENAGTWGSITNTNLYLLQQAIGGYEAISIAGGAQTTALTMSNGAISNARNAVIKLTGTITGNQIVTVPTGIEKTYIVSNGTVGAFTVQFIQAGGTGVTFATTDKSTKILFADGTNIVDTGTVSETGIQTLTNKTLTTPTLTSPIINEIDDANSNEQIKFTATASAVNEFTVTNAATGNAPEISATGGDTNIDLKITPKGTGKVVLDGIKYPNADGSANQVLKTDGSGNLSFATPSAGFSGSTTTSSAVDITLTNASTQVQYVTMTATGKSVILPDATTLATEGSPIYVIYNDGVIPIFVKNSAGVILITAAPSNTIELTLLDNSTSGGTWSSQFGPINISSFNFKEISNTTSGVNIDLMKVAPYQNGINLEKIDSSTFIFTYHAGTTQRDVYGVVCSYSGSTITVNSATLLYDGSTTASTFSQSVMLDATTGLLIVCRAANSIAVPFTISGTSITVGTASATFGTANSATGGNIDKPISMSSTLALFSEASTDGSVTKKFRVIQHNGGSAPTIGTLSTDTITDLSQELSIHLGKIDATKAFCAFAGAGNDMSACVITISGTSAPTRGTVNTDATLSTTYVSDIFADSSSQFIVFGSGFTAKYTVSGTTVTFVSETAYKTYGTFNVNAVALLNLGGGTEDFQIATGNGALSSGAYDTQLYYYQRSGDAYYPKQTGITYQINNNRLYLLPYGGYNMGATMLDSTTFIMWSTLTGTTAFVATVVKEL